MARQAAAMPTLFKRSPAEKLPRSFIVQNIGSTSATLSLSGDGKFFVFYEIK